MEVAARLHLLSSLFTSPAVVYLFSLLCVHPCTSTTTMGSAVGTGLRQLRNIRHHTNLSFVCFQCFVCIG